MKHDAIVDGESMSDVEGNEVSYLLGSAMIIDLQREPQRAAFNAYKVAFRKNEADPNLPNAAALVCAWNDFATVMGLSPL